MVVGLNYFGESWRYGKQNIDPLPCSYKRIMPAAVISLAMLPICILCLLVILTWFYKSA
jgi:hypothetical protein